MAVSPTGLKVIGKGGEILGGAIGTAIATRKTPLDKSNLAELEDLRRKEELNMLGLSEQERSLLEATYGSQLRDIAKEGERRRRQQMAVGDIFGGAALQQAALSDQAIAEANIKAAAAITEADLARKAQREAEIVEREKIESERLRARAGAFGGLIGKGIGELATIPSEKIEEEGQLDPVLINRFQEKYSIPSRSQAVSILKSMSEDPDLASILLPTLR